MEGGHRTRLREQLMCFGVPPAPYIKEERGGGWPRGAPGRVGLPPLALLEKEGGREKEERGALPPPSLSYSD